MSPPLPARAWVVLQLCAVALEALPRVGVSDPPGPVFPPVPRWASSFTDGAVVQQLIDEAISSGSSAVEIPAGNYKFTDNVKILSIRGASGLEIQGQGPEATSFWFYPGYGVEVLDCVDVTLRGVSTDTVTPPHSQGRVLSVSFASSSPTITVEIEDGFPLLDDGYLFNATCPDGSPGRCSETKVVFWDPKTRFMVRPQQMNNPMGSVNCSVATRRCTLEAPVDPDVRAVGSLATFSPRLWATDNPIPTYYRGTYLVYNCTRALFENVATYSAGDMVWVEVLGAGGNVYRNVNIVRRKDPPYAPRLLAANDDGFHSMSVEKGPTYEECEVSFLADDYVNVHNRLLPVQSLESGATTAWVVDVGLTPGPVNNEGFSGVTHIMPFIQRGDHFKVFALETNTLLGTLVVASARWVNQGTGDVPELPKPLANRVEPSALQLWRVEFDPNAPGASPPSAPVANYSSVVQIDRFGGKGARIQRNYFHESYNNVGRFAASNLVFRDNRVGRTGDGIHVSYDIVAGFLEGSLGMTNISILNNTFEAVEGCGANRSGGKGCDHICSNITCVLSHVDPALDPQVHAAGNKF